MTEPAPKHRAITRCSGARTMELVVLTDRAQARGDLLEVIGAAVEGGARAVLLREKDLPYAHRRALALQLLETLSSVGGLLLLASDVELARQVGAAGVHLAGGDPWPDRRSHPHGGDDGLLVGRSCHTVAELRDARRQGADYATISPVFSTMSKPGYGPPLGLEGLASACRSLVEDEESARRSLPLIALGGVGSGAVAACLAAGAAGVAVMGEVMRADDPASTVRALLGELLVEPRSTPFSARVSGGWGGEWRRGRSSLDGTSAPSGVRRRASGTGPTDDLGVNR